MLAACASPPEVPAAGAAAVSPGASGARPSPRASVERLPAGPGRDLLAARCIGCHDLGGLDAFRGYYDAARWRRLVDTMIAHGAKLDETEVDSLVVYLVEHFGPGTR